MGIEARTPARALQVELHSLPAKASRTATYAPSAWLTPQSLSSAWLPLQRVVAFPLEAEADE